MKKTYQAPEIKTLTAEQILSAIGPAHAIYGTLPTSP